MVEIDLLVDAAVWIAASSTQIKNEAGYRHAVRQRILADGATPEDYQAVEAYKREQERLNQQRAIAEQTDQAAALATALATKKSAAAQVHFASLDEAQRAMLLDEFVAHLTANNSAVFQFYRRSGLESKAVQAELSQFILDLEKNETEEATV